MFFIYIYNKYFVEILNKFKKSKYEKKSGKYDYANKNNHTKIVIWFYIYIYKNIILKYLKYLKIVDWKKY